MDSVAFHSAIGFETLTPDDTTAEGISAALLGKVGNPDYLGATKVRFSVEGASIRYRYDGTAPTSGVGHEVAVGETVELTGEGNVRNLLMISTNVAGSTVRITTERA